MDEFLLGFPVSGETVHHGKEARAAGMLAAAGS